MSCLEHVSFAMAIGSREQVTRRQFWVSSLQSLLTLVYSHIHLYACKSICKIYGRDFEGSQRVRVILEPSSRDVKQNEEAGRRLMNGRQAALEGL